MIYDALLEFSNGQSAVTGVSQVVDLGQVAPRLGLVGRKFFILVRAGESFAATNIKVEVQDSADGSTGWNTIDSTGTLSNFKQAIIPVPVDSKRYMRLSYTVTGGAGKINAMLTDNVSDVGTITREIA